MKSDFKKFVKDGNSERFVTKLIKSKMDFSIRNGSECTEVLLDDTHYVFSSTNNFPRNKVYLFRVVQQSVRKWLKNNELILPPHQNSIHYNYEYDTDRDVLTGTDLNHAYWRIAYLYGMITEKTYIAGLDSNCKALRLATLSVLGREKKFRKYEKGLIGETFVYQNPNDKLQDVFKFIRLTCFNFMYEASKMLKNDFFAWKTDCIYYKDTEENIEMIQSYFDNHGLTYKQLGY